MKDPDATRYDDHFLPAGAEKRLQVMDATAISLCMDNKLPIVVFNLRTPGNLRRVVTGRGDRHGGQGVAAAVHRSLRWT